MAGKIPVTMTFTINDMTSKALSDINQRLEQLNSSAGKFNSTLDENKAKMQAFSTATKSIGQGLVKIGAALTAGITLPVVAFGVAAVKSAATFEQSMNDLQARTQSSAEDMTLLSAEARKLGISTVFGASDASKAMTELGKAGFTTQQIIKSTGSVLNLAAAESLDMGSAATLVSDTINQFGLKADDATSVVDMLGKAAGISSIDIVQLQNSLKYASPAAARFGITLAEVSGAIAQLGQRGIKSEMAGTTIRSFFNSITADTERQNKLMKAGVFGKDLFIDKDTLRDLPTMLGVLKKANLSATQLSDIFGKEFGGNISGLIEDSSLLGKTVADVMDSSGFEAEVAAARTQGFNGEILKLKNSFEELGIAVAYGEDGRGSLLSWLTSGVELAKDAVMWFHNLSPEIQNIGIFGAIAAAAIGPLLAALGGFLLILPGLLTGFGLLTGLIDGVALSIGGVELALTPILGPIAALVLALGALYLAWGNIADIMKFVTNGLFTIPNWFIKTLGFNYQVPQFRSGLGQETGVNMGAGLSRAFSPPVAGSFKAAAPSFDTTKFDQFYGTQNAGNINKSEVMINLGGFIPPGTTTRVSPNSDAFVTLNRGGAMQ